MANWHNDDASEDRHESTNKTPDGPGNLALPPFLITFRLRAGPLLVCLVRHKSDVRRALTGANSTLLKLQVGAIMSNGGELCKSGQLADSASLEALLFPEVAVVMITTLVPPRSPRSTVGGLPITRFVLWANLKCILELAALENAAPLKALLFPEVAVVMITAWSPLGPPAQRGADFP